MSKLPHRDKNEAVVVSPVQQIARILCGVNLGKKGQWTLLNTLLDSSVRIVVVGWYGPMTAQCQLMLQEQFGMNIKVLTKHKSIAYRAIVGQQKAVTISSAVRTALNNSIAFEGAQKLPRFMPWQKPSTQLPDDE